MLRQNESKKCWTLKVKRVQYPTYTKQVHPAQAGKDRSPTHKRSRSVIFCSQISEAQGFLSEYEEEDQEQPEGGPSWATHMVRRI